MPALILIALGLIAGAIWYVLHAPEGLTDDQIQQLMDEYWAHERIGDFDRASEILSDLHREGVTVRLQFDYLSWERK